MENLFRIDRLRVENFRGFAEREFDFHPQFNVLIGDNATGKTAALEALAVALDPWIYGATGRHERRIGRDDLRVVPSPEGGMTRIGRPYECIVDAQVAGAFVRLAGRSLGEELSDSATIDLVRRGRDAMQAAGRGGGGVLLPITAHYGTDRSTEGSFFGARRREREDLQAGPLERELGYERALRARISARLFDDWMQQQALEAFQNDGHELPQSAVTRRALARCVEGVADVRYLARSREVVAEFEDGRILPVRLLSQGQLRILRLVGDLARRMVQLNPWLEDRVLTETPGVVLIDELELHLHPNWQRRIVDDLRRTFPAVQFIVTTHSPLVIGEVPPESVLLLSDPAVTVPTASQSFGLDANRVMMWVMGTAGVQAREVASRLAEARLAIQQRRLGDAQNLSDEVRDLQRGDTPDTVELDTLIANLEALADDADDHEN